MNTITDTSRFWPLPGPAAGTETPPALCVRRLAKQFGDGAQAVHALRGVDLDLPTGGFLALMGPSGSGKTTLLQCIGALEAPDAGSITIAGTELSGLDGPAREAVRRDAVGMVFQHYHLIPYLTAEQNVALPLELRGRSDRAGVAAALESVGMADRAGHLPRQLSGGQQQRVAIARALVTDPPLLLADEPTGALDRASAHQVLDLLRDLVDNQQRTILMVTHDPVAAGHADRVLYLADGRVISGAERPTVEEISATLATLDDLARDARSVAS